MTSNTPVKLKEIFDIENKTLKSLYSCVNPFYLCLWSAKYRNDIVKAGSYRKEGGTNVMPKWIWVHEIGIGRPSFFLWWLRLIRCFVLNRYIKFTSLFPWLLMLSTPLILPLQLWDIRVNLGLVHTLKMTVKAC